LHQEEVTVRIKLLCAAAVLVAALACPAQAQVVTSYYVAPAPAVAPPVLSCYAPPAPVVSYYAAPILTVSYYAPPAPAVSYYAAPAPVVSYAAPAPVVSYYAGPSAVTYRYGLFGRRSVTYYYP
jgi:hypothetical protein